MFYRYRTSYLYASVVIKLISDLRQVDGFHRLLANKSDHHDIAEILLKVALKTINHPTNHNTMTEILTRGCINYCRNQS